MCSYALEMIALATWQPEVTFQAQALQYKHRSMRKLKQA
jgi:hypothetical protein